MTHGGPRPQVAHLARPAFMKSGAPPLSQKAGPVQPDVSQKQHG